MALIAAHLNAGIILVVTAQRYVYISLSPPPPPPPHLQTPFPLFSPSLISLTVSVDVEYHVYLLTYFQNYAVVCYATEGAVLISAEPLPHGPSPCITPVTPKDLTLPASFSEKSAKGLITVKTSRGSNAASGHARKH